MDTKGIKNIAMITNNGSYGKGEHDAFLKALKSRSVTPVADQVVTTDQKDFSAALTTIRQKAPQVIFLGAEEVESGLIVKQARDLGITVPFAGGAPQGTPVFADTAGAAAIEGTIVSSPYLSNDVSDASKKFAAAYKAAYNEDAELHGAKAYDGAQILLTALKTSNVAKGKALADAIRATKHQGLLGNFAYDETGVGIFATSIGIITNGKLVASQPAEVQAMQVFLQTFIGGLSLGAVYALVALGFSLVYRTMGLVNFAHGNVVMLGAYLASTFYLTAKLPFAVAMLVAIVSTGMVGVIIERVLRPLENKDFDLMLIGTIGFGIVLEALAILIWGATGRAVPSPVPAAPLDLFGIRVRTYNLVVLAIAAVATLLLVLFLQRTKRGRGDAGGRDGPRGGHRGRHPRRTQQRDRLRHRRRPGRTGRRAGRAAALRQPVDGRLAGHQGLRRRPILGGFGSIPGAIVGGLAIGVLDSFAAGHFQGYSELVTFVVFTIIIVVRPTGIFGERTVNRA